MNTRAIIDGSVGGLLVISMAAATMLGLHRIAISDLNSRVEKLEGRRGLVLQQLQEEVWDLNERLKKIEPSHYTEIQQLQLQVGALMEESQ